MDIDWNWHEEQPHNSNFNTAFFKLDELIREITKVPKPVKKYKDIPTKPYKNLLLKELNLTGNKEKS